MASELAAKFGNLPEGSASIDVFNSLMELALGIADPAARGQVAQALTFGIWALPEGIARIDGFNRLVELARGIIDPVARRQVTQALVNGLRALPAGAERR